jgi:hypothetical protein
MKKILLAISLVLSSFNFIGTPAHADDQCTSANPCGTWAVVDSSGVVRNIIVCEERVCGASGSWHGVMPNDTPWPGARIVLQVPPNPVTNQSQGGYLGTPSNPVTYDAQAQVFSQGNATTPAPITRSEVVDTTTISATINSNTVTFGPNNFVNGQMQFAPKVTPTTGATISASQTNGETRTVTRVITNSKGETSTVTVAELITTDQSTTFNTPQTRTQIQQSIQGKLAIIERYLNRFYELLRGWVID